MPSNSQSIGNLEIPSITLALLNDRFRRIGLALAGTASTTATADGGGASEVVLAVPGMLAIQSDCAPVFSLAAAQSFSKALIFLKQAPVGAVFTVQLYVAGAAWGGAISTSGTTGSVSVARAGSIAANALIRVDITSVGTTFPGSDLTVILR